MSAYPYIKLNHSPLISYTGNAQLNWPGAWNIVGKRGTLPTFTNSNSIFMAKSGSDSNAGTLTAPKLTLNGAMAAIVGTMLSYVCILDSGTYNEGFTTQYTPAQLPNFLGIYAADGQAPVFTIIRGAITGTYGAGNAARTTSGTPNYYIAKNGNDVTGARGNALQPFLTIQAALNNGSRMSGDIFEIQDSGIYHEDLTFGSLPAVLRGAQGTTPTIKAFILTVSNGQISWTTNAAVVSVDGLIIDGTGSENFAYGTINGTTTAASISFLNCSFLNQYNMALKASAIFTNCLFSEVATFGYTNTGFEIIYTITNSFVNCYFSNSLNNGSQTPLPLGFQVTQVKNCTFNNVVVTGSWGFQTSSPTYAVPQPIGAFDSNFTFDRCFLNNSSINMNYLFLASYYASSTILWTANIQNTTVNVGQIIFENDSHITTGSQRVNLYFNNVVVYAYGFTVGIYSLGQTANAGGGAAFNCDIQSFMTNVIVSGAETNYLIQRWNHQQTQIQNCTSLNASSTGLSIIGQNSGYAVTSLVITAFLDSNSPTPWISPGYAPLNSESGASVISFVQGNENCTLSANDPGNFGGPQNANGGDTSIGYDYAMFDLSVSCILNGLTFAGWTYPGIPSGNMEGGIQSSVGALIQVQNCDFTTSGTFAVKAAPGTTVTNSIFTNTSGHAIASNQTGVMALDNVGNGCAGAFYMNYGQAAVIRHNTAYGCEYGQFDALQVASEISDSNIFNGSGAYDYSGNNTLTYSCVGTLDPGTLAAVDIYSTQLDPLFRSANFGDLQIESFAFGYLWNSPCILSASDGQDMGAYNLNYGVQSTAWTLIDFSITGPVTGEQWVNPDSVARKRVSVKLAEGLQEDGTLYSVAATYKAQYTMTWNEDTNNMPLDQMQALLTMFISWTNKIQIDWGDGRGFVPGFFGRQKGFEYEDMGGAYANPEMPEPVKQIVLQEA